MSVGFVLLFIAVVVIVCIVVPTFFASASKFTKGVGQIIGRYFHERRQYQIQRTLNDLARHRSMVRQHKSERETLLLKRHEKRSPIEGKYYQDNVEAARNQLYSERIECMKCWRFLERHDALPMDTSTRRRWKDFDEYLSRDSMMSKRIYA